MSSATSASTSSAASMRDTYDFVIVGGGTAGLTVANRLTEDPSIQVLVLEAGSNAMADPRVNVPALWTALLGSELDWDFLTTPQEGLNGRQIGHPQGRLLGGSSALNAENFAPLSSAVFNAWESLGNPGWAWDEVAPYGRKSYTLNPPSKEVAAGHSVDWINDEIRATSGPIQASFTAVAEDPLGRAWVESFKELKYQLRGDPFAGSTTGAWSQVSSVDPHSKTRSYAASAYYAPIAWRPNLTVQTDASVQKIVLDMDSTQPKATGVQVRLAGQAEVRTVSASREVILAAGVFQTPKILELSGIGNKAILEKHGIKVVVDNPFVGENLQDHLMTGISFEAADGVMTGDALVRQEPEMIQACMQMYQEHRAGPFAMASLGTFAYMPIMEEFTITPTNFAALMSENKPGPDASKWEKKQYDYLWSILKNPDEGSGALFMLASQVNLHNGPKMSGMLSGGKPGSYLSIGAALAHPFSRGSCHLASGDPDASPVIDPQYLSHPLDIEVHARHMLAVEKLAATAPLSNYIKPDGVRAQPGNRKLTSLDAAKEYVRETCLTNNHPVGTCAMMPRELGGVVDPRLRVHGVSGLRVVDASIMPLIVRGNSQSAVYAVAEKAADMVKEDYGLVDT